MRYLQLVLFIYATASCIDIWRTVFRAVASGGGGGGGHLEPQSANEASKVLEQRLVQFAVGKPELCVWGGGMWGVTPPIIVLSRHLEPQSANEALQLLEQGSSRQKSANLEVRFCRLQMYRVSKHWRFAELFVISCFYFVIHCILLTKRRFWVAVSPPSPVEQL